MSISERIIKEAAAMSGSKESKARRCAENAVSRYLSKFRKTHSAATSGIYTEVFATAMRLINPNTAAA